VNNPNGVIETLDEALDRVVRTALAEDIGTGDLTSDATLPADGQSEAVFLAKADGVVAGLEVARRVFEALQPSVYVAFDVSDGERVQRGQIFGGVRGNSRALLTGERTALNLLQRMSGIASATRRYVDAVAAVPGARAVVLDTRKTAPGMRLLDKWAVRLGGGQNHRTGLYDMALIKDNHIAAVGSISEAVRRVRSFDMQARPIEVEVTTLAQLNEALMLHVDRILLDNMAPALMAEAVGLAHDAAAASGHRTPLEASGNVSLDTIAAIAATGVDFISIGALTHSVAALDISLDIREI
jgi:nicotinate-nucleotide pyrophosphorylase (carboxylating)